MIDATEPLMPRLQRLLVEVSQQPDTTPISVAESQLGELVGLARKYATNERAAWPVEEAVAHSLFSEAFRRRSPIATCVRYYDVLCQLGFRHLAHKSSAALILARRYGEEGMHREALQLLTDLSAEIDQYERAGCHWPQIAVEMARIDLLIGELQSSASS
jgi:hypothetical protein